MKTIQATLGLVAISLTLFSCGNSGTDQPKASDKPAETYNTGAISIAVDESYKPIMTQVLQVFDSSNPKANITPIYLPENDCVQSILEGKVKSVYMAREFSKEEIKALNSRKLYPKTVVIAADAIAIIVNPKSVDKKMTMGILTSILQDKYARKYNVVFDSNKGSIVRYISDSVLLGAKLTANVSAAKNSQEVIDYVAKNENAIGIIGVSHAYDPNSNQGYGTFKSNVQVVALKRDTATTDFVQPYQAAIILKDYPLVRKSYFTYTDISPLAKGFASFLTGEQGQLIYNQARMYPLNSQFVIREVEIKH